LINHLAGNFLETGPSLHRGSVEVLGDMSLGDVPLACAFRIRDQICFTKVFEDLKSFFT